MAYENDGKASDQRLIAVLAPNLTLLSAVRETRNITRAAELLGIPQPTVSRRLAALAEVVGAPLTEPDGRGIRLTRVGAILAETASRALPSIEAGARQVREEIEPTSGRVVLGFLHLLGRWVVPNLLRGFREQHPGVRFSLVQGSRQHILDALVAGELDLALVAPAPENLESITIAEQDLLLCVPTGHRLARRRRIRFAELADEPFVMLEHGYGVRQITDALCADAGFEPKIVFEGQESDTVRGLVAAGFGVALLPRFGTAAPAGVVEIPLSPKRSREICLTWRAGEHFTPAVRSFRDFVRAQA